MIYTTISVSQIILLTLPLQLTLALLLYQLTIFSLLEKTLPLPLKNNNPKTYLFPLQLH